MRSRTRFWMVALCGTAALAVAGCQSHEYSDNTRREFVASCTAQPGATVKACECALKKIEAEVPEDKLKSEEDRLRDGAELPTYLVRALGTCRH